MASAEGGRAAAPWRPSKEDLAAAVDARVPDVVAPGLRVLFCGTNPGLYTAAVGHHFARPGNRFWRALFESGFTDRLYRPDEDATLVELGLGLTNLVARPTARADELSADEIRRGGEHLCRFVAHHRPRVVAVLGLGAYRQAFDRAATIGLQDSAPFAARSFVLPNPSGLQAHYQLPQLVELFRALSTVAGVATP